MSDERGMDPADWVDGIFRFDSCQCGCDGPDNYSKSPANSMRDFVVDVWDTIDELGNLLLKKQEDYGPLNISNAPGGPLNGLRVRIFDKVSRINNLIDNEVDDPNFESLRDSFMDLANYGIIALMVLDGVWPQLKVDNK